MSKFRYYQCCGLKASKHMVQTQICRAESICGGYISHIQHIGGSVMCGGVHARYIHHGFQFDRILPYKPANSIPSNELDDVSRISIKTLPFPSLIKDKLFQLIKAAGKKKDIDASGSYIAKRLAARRSVEVPRVLPSILLDSDSVNAEYVEGMKQLSNEPEFAHLKTLFQQNKLGVNEQAQIELAEAEDARHKMKLRAPQLKPTRIMFYNAGAGASVAAAHAIWDLNTFEDILIVEPSTNLLKICEYLIPGKITACQEPLESNQSGRIHGTHCCCRQWKFHVQAIVEPGTPTGFRILHSIREVFISQLEKDRFHFMAPPPLKLGRRVIMDLCSAPNNFKRIVVPKNTPESSGYK
ncbi:mitochondrial ribosomal protein S22 [Babesia ovata]|uniref:Mitochondrial ribosomal protein S22 n=1 Tax=Babesia ovata TaxID=189622 RepID=A0A2H6K9P4_9APIC|nr:mitochondrial ribosomal protein S22 [Babesia ovata]GBE59705.1 mitochondrial ribosomal protein S22 [Babesia ovata]